SGTESSAIARDATPHALGMAHREHTANAVDAESGQIRNSPTGMRFPQPLQGATSLFTTSDLRSTCRRRGLDRKPARASPPYLRVADPSMAVRVKKPLPSR